MKKTCKITVEEYLDNKGELHQVDMIYDSKGDYIGHFDGFDPDLKAIQVNLNGKCKLEYYWQCMVEIEYTPIYVAL